MKRAFLSIPADKSGATAAEFAIILPLLLILIFGLIDAGRLMWTWNKAEKATQMGVRYAVSTDTVADGIDTYSALGLVDTNGKTLSQGDSLKNYNFGSATCQVTTTNPADDPTCSCNSGSCPWIGSVRPNAFTRIYDQMHRFFPELERNDVSVTYSNSGLGFAGDPNRADFNPLVTVAIRPSSVDFKPITLIVFQPSISLPAFAASLTMEDGSGIFSN